MKKILLVAVLALGLGSCSNKVDELKKERATLVKQQKVVLEEASDLLSVNEVEQARQTTRVKKNMLNAINEFEDKALLSEIAKKGKEIDNRNLEIDRLSAKSKVIEKDLEKIDAALEAIK